MAVHTYECLFLLDPNKTSADPAGVQTQVNEVIERCGGEILVSLPWGEPKLAYPIEKFRKGSYLLTYFKSEATAIAQMEEIFRLSEVLLRHLIIKLHPKIAEDNLAHLRGERPAPEPTPEGEGGERGERRGRGERDRERVREYQR